MLPDRPNKDALVHRMTERPGTIISRLVSVDFTTNIAELIPVHIAESTPQGAVHIQ